MSKQIEVLKNMRRNLTLVGKMGIVLAIIGFAIVLYSLIAIFANASTIIPSSWLLSIALFLGAAGILMNQGNRQTKQTPS
jgi:hypothetical protein